ncbi:MAG: rod shape-determining protein MreC [Chitinophagales bacterium]
MYNLFRFLVRYYLFLFFLILEGFCFYLIYLNNRYHQALYVNVANEASGRVYQSYSKISDYLSLGSYNDSLVQENARLRAQLLQSKYENVKVIGTVSDTLEKKLEQVYNYVPAKVIRNSVNQASNYIFIDKGSLQGIEPQMGVINMNGVVGQVVNVTPHYSAVMSLLNKNFRVGAKLKKSQYFGPLFWDGKSTTIAHLEEIPKHVKIAIGDTVVTSGYSELFPEGIMIGRVKRFVAEPDKNFLEIDVQLSANLNNLSYVYIVTNLFRNELVQLDTTTANKKK